MSTSPTVRPSQVGIAALITRQGYEGTGTLTTLIVSDLRVHPARLAILLAWPKHLEHFTFGNTYSNHGHWELSMFESLLAPHRFSLKSITIGSSPIGRGRINVTGFPELTSLELSHWGWHCSPEQAILTILAPKLKEFTWNFDSYDSHIKSWYHFAQPQVDWVLTFAKLASAQRSALKEFVIRFQQDEWAAPHSREEYEAVRYPWDRMDQLALALEPLGIILSYTPAPSHTRMKVEKRIEEMESREKARY
jgi:hypothetical protein